MSTTMGLPLIIAGGANVRHPHFNLSRPRSCDVMVFSFVDLLVMSCNLRCATPVHRSPTSAEPVKIASSSPEVVPLESRCTRESDVACRLRLAVQCSDQVTVSVLPKLFSSQCRPDQRSGLGLFCEIGGRLCSAHRDLLRDPAQCTRLCVARTMFHRTVGRWQTSF